MDRVYYDCCDGFCGALDCGRCHPELQHVCQTCHEKLAYCECPDLTTCPHCGTVVQVLSGTPDPETCDHG